MGYLTGLAMGRDLSDLQLARFKGRPGEMSPKARFWMFAGWLLPSRFKYETIQSIVCHKLTDTPAAALSHPLIVMTGLFDDHRREKRSAM
jgi:hypothetical protein